MTRYILAKLVPPQQCHGLFVHAEALHIVGFLPVFDDWAAAREFARSDEDVIAVESKETPNDTPND